MSWSEFLLFVHVTATAVWVGAGVALEVVGARFDKAGDPAAAAAYGKHTANLGEKLFMPCSILVLVTGILMVLDSRWEFQDAFIAFGIGAVIVSSVIGAAVLGPLSNKLAALVEKGAPASAINVQTKRFLGIARLNTLLLVVAIFFMSVKPFS